MPEAPKLSLKRAENVALGALIVQIVLTIATFLAGRYSGSLAVHAEYWHLAIGIPLWLVVLVHQRLKRLAEEEVLELEELAKLREREGAARSGSLFEEGRVDPYAARGRLERFEKWMSIAFSIVMVAALVGVSLDLYLTAAPAYDVKTINLAATGEVAIILFGQAVVAFLLAKYAAGMSSQEAWRPLRAGASYMMSNCVLLVLLALGHAFLYFDIWHVDVALAWVIPGLLGLIGVEILLTLVLDFYRPRTGMAEHRPPYDSRLLGMLTEGGGLLGTVSEALNYQFGFRVSETWFYRFMEKAIAPLVLFQLITFWALTSVLIVGPGEVAFVERWGAVKQVDGHPKPYDPGFYIKWPWPIERSRICKAADVRTLSIGDPWMEKGGRRYRNVLWTVPHTQEPYIFLVGSKESENRAIFLSGRIYVQYNVPYDPGADRAGQWKAPYNYLYTINNPDEQLVREDFSPTPQKPEPAWPLDYETRMDRMVKNIAYREAIIYISGVDINEFLTSSRRKAAHELRRRIQQQADDLELGVNIVSVSLEEIHPPLTTFGTGEEEEGGGIAAAFERVAGAQFEREAKVIEALIDKDDIETDALSQSYGKVKSAEADSFVRVKRAEGTAERLLTRYEIYKDVETLYLEREYLRAVVEAIGDARKTIRPAWQDTQDVLILNLDEMLQTLGTALTNEGD